MTDMDRNKTINRIFSLSPTNRKSVLEQLTQDYLLLLNEWASEVTEKSGDINSLRPAIGSNVEGILSSIPEDAFSEDQKSRSRAYKRMPRALLIVSLLQRSLLPDAKVTRRPDEISGVVKIETKKLLMIEHGLCHSVKKILGD